jgi:hypothetical protein
VGFGRLALKGLPTLASTTKALHDGVVVEAGQTETPVFFLADAVEVTRPRAFVEERLHVEGTDLLPMASKATGDGEGFVLRVGPALGRHVLGVPVTVRLGSCFTRQGSAAIPIRWEAVAFESLFPVLDGTFLLSAVDESRCRLGIEASYRVPMERLGEVLNRAVLHRVAESTIRSFLEQLAGAFTVDAGSVGEGDHTGTAQSSNTMTGGPAKELRRWSATTQTVLDEHLSPRGLHREP